MTTTMQYDFRLPPPIRVRARSDFHTRGGIYAPLHLRKGEIRILYGPIVDRLLADGIVEPATDRLELYK